MDMEEQLEKAQISIGRAISISEAISDVLFSEKVNNDALSKITALCYALENLCAEAIKLIEPVCQSMLSEAK